jgi:hypothetical protein
MNTETKKRVETTVLQFGDDFPGVFIRGDHAAYYSLVLRDLLSKTNGEKSIAHFDPIALALHSKKLIEILSCSHGDMTPETLHLMSLEHCIA